jgi:ribosomal protein S17
MGISGIISGGRYISAPVSVTICIKVSNQKKHGSYERTEKQITVPTLKDRQNQGIEKSRVVWFVWITLLHAPHICMR